MHTSDLRDALESLGALRQDGADLAWSLWSELGVSGVVRNHSGIVIDLEPLLVVTPTLAADDPRLLEQVLSWCVSHADRVNSSRLTTLVKALPMTARTAFEGFATTINAVAKTQWPAMGPVWNPLPRIRTVSLPLERPSLVRLRARALCGVGTRADVLCDLLAHPQMWSTAASLAEEGHSKRNVARVLAEFDTAGMVVRQVSSNTLRFRLARPSELTAVLGGFPMASPPWIKIFELIIKIFSLLTMNATPIVRRVETNTLRDTLAPLAEALWLDAPPQTRGNPDAWERLIHWGAEQMSTLAHGTSAALGVARN